MEGLRAPLDTLRWPNFGQGLARSPPGALPPIPGSGVPSGQLKEVVKVLEKLNRSGRWKWLLHHRESKKLRGDLR